MRRFLAFAMCLSGFTLTFSWSRAAEPTVAAAAQDAPSAPEATDLGPADPPSRPVVIRTEPGSYRAESRPASSSEAGRLERIKQSLLQRLNELQERYSTPEFIAQQQRQLAAVRTAQLHALEDLRAQMRGLSGEYAGEAFESIQQQLEKQLAAVEARLEENHERQVAVASQAEREVTRTQESDADSNAERHPEVYREMRRRREQAGNAVAEQVEQRLQQLRETAEELIESGAEQAEVARREIEQEIDNLERYLVERRERRDAVEREHDRPRPADEELHQRMRHIQAAIEHLNAAGMQDVANDLRKHAEALQHQAATQHALREQQQALERQQRQLQEHAAHLQQREAAVRVEAEASRTRAREVARTAEARDGRIDAPALAEQLGDLRREVRRLRQEVQELREAHARPNRD